MRYWAERESERVLVNSESLMDKVQSMHWLEGGRCLPADQRTTIFPLSPTCVSIDSVDDRVGSPSRREDLAQARVGFARAIQSYSIMTASFAFSVLVIERH